MHSCFFLSCSLEGKGSEVLLLSGDADVEAGAVDEENANRKTVCELLSLNPHDSNVFHLLSLYNLNIVSCSMVIFSPYSPLGCTLYMSREYKRN